MSTAVPLQLLDADARSALSSYRNLLVNARFWITMMRAIPAAAIVFAGSTENASVAGGVAGISPMSAYLPFAVTAANGYVIGLVVAFDAEITA